MIQLAEMLDLIHFFSMTSFDGKELVFLLVKEETQKKLEMELYCTL